LLREVALGNTDHARPAAEKLNALLDAPAAAAPLAEVAEACRVAGELQLRPLAGVANVAERGLELVAQRGDAHPRGALAVLAAVAPVARDANAVWAAQQQLLEPVVARQPEDAELAGRLAQAYEAQNQLAKCEALLTPHRKRLGATEGARILGRIYAQ